MGGVYNNSMSKVTVYIDESGTLPDPADKVVVVAAVGMDSLAKIDNLLKRVRKKASFKKPSGELKFYTAGDKTKLLFFKLLKKEGLIICTMTVDKMGRKIADTPENYAALCWLLLSDVLSFTTDIKGLVFDRHFSRSIDMDKFNTIIRKLLGGGMPIHHVDSARDKRVTVADMVAGAILAKEAGKDKRFYKVLEGMITSSKRVNWKEVKKHFLATKKLA